MDILNVIVGLLRDDSKESLKRNYQKRKASFNDKIPADFDYKNIPKVSGLSPVEIHFSQK